MKVTHLWVDIKQKPSEDWAWAQTLEETKILLQRNTIQVLSLGYDFGSYTRKSGITGISILELILSTMRLNRRWIPPSHIYIHEENLQKSLLLCKVGIRIMKYANTTTREVLVSRKK